MFVENAVKLEVCVRFCWFDFRLMAGEDPSVDNLLRACPLQCPNGQFPSVNTHFTEPGLRAKGLRALPGPRPPFTQRFLDLCALKIHPLSEKKLQAFQVAQGTFGDLPLVPNPEPKSKLLPLPKPKKRKISTGTDPSSNEASSSQPVVEPRASPPSRPPSLDPPKDPPVEDEF